MKNSYKSIAISRNEADYIRILPWGTIDYKAELKFSFIDKSFLIRRFVKNENGILSYKYDDLGVASHEITYHNSNENHLNAAILPKYKDLTVRLPILEEVIDLDLRDLIVPIPICRITINKESEKKYKHKDYHCNIDLTGKYNTTEIYISSLRYDLQTLSDRFPNIVGNLFLTTTIDYIVYGAGLGSEHLFNKLFENSEPVTSLTSVAVGNYRLYYKSYELKKVDPSMIYSGIEYEKDNIIEFFNNVDYLDLLATTKLGFEIGLTGKYDTRPAYKFDIENLRKINFHKDYITRWNTRFSKKEIELSKIYKMRSGVLIKNRRLIWQNT